MSSPISSALIGSLQAEAAASPDREICGLLLGTDGMVTAKLPIANIAEDPSRGFLLDPQAHLAASRSARDAGQAILGCYHSHPSGDPSPSLADAGEATEEGRYWLILTNCQARLWRARRGGPVLGAFEPVPLAYGEASPCNLVAQGPIGGKQTDRRQPGALNA